MFCLFLLIFGGIVFAGIGASDTPEDESEKMGDVPHRAAPPYPETGGENGTREVSGGIVGGEGETVPRKRTLFETAFRAEGDPEVGSSTTLTATIEAIEAVDDATVRVRPQPHFGVSEENIGLGDMAAGETRRVEIPIEPRRAIDRDVNIEITGSRQDRAFRRSFAHSLRLASEGDERAARQTGRSDREQSSSAMTIRSGLITTESTTEGGPIGANDTAGSETTTLTAQSAGYTAETRSTSTDATVRGRFLYQDFETGKYRSAGRLVVELYDEDPGSDQRIARGRSNATGAFAFSFDTTQYDGDSTADVYAKIYAFNPAANVTNATGVQYTSVTPTYDNISAGETHDFGDLSSVANNPAWVAADAALDEREFIRTSANGWTREPIQIAWENGSFPKYKYGEYDTSTGELNRDTERIKLPNRSTDFAWGDVTVFHEYGHGTMTAMYDWNYYNLPERGLYSCHYPISETDSGFALIEGWAEFMQVAVEDHPENLRWGVQDTETNEFYNTTYSSSCPTGDTGDMDGNRVEGSGASIWFDIIDVGHANDDALEKPFATVFDTIKDNNVQSIQDFYTNWSSGSRSPLRKTYYRYGIDNNDPPTVTAPTPPQSGWINPPDSGLTVSTAASDPDGDPVQSVRFAYSTDGSSWTTIGTDSDGSDGWQVQWSDAASITRQGVSVRAMGYDGMEWGPAAADSTWDLDNSPPDAPPSLDDGISGYTDSGSATFSWNRPSDAGSGVGGYTITLDGTSSTEYNDPDRTSRSYSGLGDGEHTVAVGAFDTADPRNEGATSRHSVRVDTVAPTTTTTATDRSWTDKSEFSISATDRIGSGASVPPAGVGYVAWRLDGSSGRDGSGAHTFAPGDGKHALEYWAVDDAGSGNEEAHETVDVWIDTTAPSVSSYRLSNPGGRQLRVRFDAADATSGVRDVLVVLRDGDGNVVTRLREGDFSVDGDTYTATPTVGSDGSYSATLRTVADAAGNDGASGQSSSVGVDTTAPSISSFRAGNPSGSTMRVQFDSSERLADIGVRVTDSAGNTVRSIGEGAFSRSGDTYTWSGSLSDGRYTATLRTAADADGNDGASGQTDGVTIDTTAPSVSGFDVSASDQDVDVSFTASEPLGAIRVELGDDASGVLDGSDFTATSTGGGGVAYRADLSDGRDGTFSARLETAADSTGNDGASGQTDSVTVDTSDGDGGDGGSGDGLPKLRDSYDGSPTDSDGDGRYEDVNGDGRVDVIDVQALFINRENEVVLNNPGAFDFNGNGGFNVVDVQALFDEIA